MRAPKLSLFALLSILMGLPLLTVPTAAAAQGSIPQGSYLNSCNSISVVDGVLEATCRKADQSTRFSALSNPYGCRGDISNQNGALVCKSAAPVQQYQAPQQPQYQTNVIWDSIAVDDDKGTKGGNGGYGVGTDSNKSGAEAAAIKECRNHGNSDCKVALSYANTCGAYASSKKYFGTGTGPTKNAAQQSALKDCDDNSCTILVVDCVGQN